MLRFLKRDLEEKDVKAVEYRVFVSEILPLLDDAMLTCYNIIFRNEST